MPSKRSEFVAKVFGNVFMEPIPTSVGTERDFPVHLQDLLPDDLKISTQPCHVVVEITLTPISHDDE